MKKKYFHYFLSIFSTISIGSIIALSEAFLTKRLDSILPETSQVSTFSRPGTITILSTKEKIIQKIGPVTREKIDREKIPLIIKQAFIAAEDRRFYRHNGIDLWSVSRALKENFNNRSFKEGASTITQQLARMVYLSQNKTISRKIKEAALSFKIERQLSKEEILEQYLNNVYLGSSAYGIADAAWVYFSKSPEVLTIPEVALIAGLAPAPSLYSPLVNQKLALKRRSIVLEKMYEEGFISKLQFSESSNSILALNPSTPKYFNSIAPFYSNWVLEKLPLYLTQEQLEIGGLKIYTSLNLDWQTKARKIINDYSIGDIEGAVVSIQPDNGLVRVLVGGKNFNKNEFNRATKAFRSPGSTFKVFTYAAALNKGFKPEDSVVDKPRCWDNYCPENFGSKYHGKVSLTYSLKHSLNSVAIHLLDQIGFDEVVSVANKLGVGNEEKLERYYSLGLGTFEETVLNMTAAYAGIANRGVYMKPSPFIKITGPGNKTIWSKKTNPQQGQKALKPAVADDLNFMLSKVVSEGTGRAAKLQSKFVTGKTGTSEGARDIWFIGSLPQLTTGIWFGHDNNQKTSNSSKIAAYSWRKFMESIEKDISINRNIQKD